MSGLSLAAGPLIGGALVDGPGWRWVFFVNLPVGVIAFLAAVRFLAESVNPHPRRLDLAGQLLGIATLGSLVYALIEGGANGWTSPLIMTMFAVAGTALAGLLGLPATLAIVVIAPLAGRVAAARGPGLPIAVGTALAGAGLIRRPLLQRPAPAARRPDGHAPLPTKAVA